MHYKTCIQKKPEVVTPTKPMNSQNEVSCRKTDQEMVDSFLEFAMSKAGGDCSPGTASNYARQLWRIVYAERSQDQNFKARHWITTSSNFKPISKPSKYLEVEMTKSQKQQLLCTYALLCKFLEHNFTDGNGGMVGNGEKIAHIHAMRGLQRLQLKTVKASIQSVQSLQVVQRPKQSTLETLTDAFRNSILRISTVKKIAREEFSLDKGVGITTIPSFAHFLALSFHLYVPQNRWEVTKNLKVIDVLSASPRPKRCEACGQYKVDFKYHVKKECPQGKILYKTRQLPKDFGFLVYQNNGLEKAVCISRCLRQAIINNAKHVGLGENDFVFPANPQSPNKPMSFWKHTRPILHAISPILTETAELEFGGKLPSDFFRKKCMKYDNGEDQPEMINDLRFKDDFQESDSSPEPLHSEKKSKCNPFFHGSQNFFLFPPLVLF